jgi:hypothetical protein
MPPVRRQPVTPGISGADPASPQTAASLAETVRALEAELATLQAITGAIAGSGDVDQVLTGITDRLLPMLDPARCWSRAMRWR